MMRKLTFVGCLLLLVTACPPGDVDYEVTTLILPEGHPEAGREAFIDLGCASCHTVEWEADLPDPATSVPAPELGRTLGLQTSGGVATSILVPSHHIPARVREKLEGDLSPMGDFTDAMTVRQLVDVVAYLRTQGSRTVARAEIETQPVPAVP